MTESYTGACQCGRVRYHFNADGAQAYLCHCRKCQRATGGFAAALVTVPGGVVWESQPAWYQSSPIARRPFCPDCGTPLGFAYDDGASESAVDVSYGSLDEPERFAPTAHFGTESIHECWIDTSALPRQRSDATQSVTRRWAAAGLEVPE
ncbi:GFA family protein [Novosphingobium sp.]|uniref:GFA family protein n=1 Tax=Novosphingobium sp. TaxID=1874826 RepID=UPI0025CC7508|nr:GFA family protein [Novosphingobium sp.]